MAEQDLRTRLPQAELKFDDEQLRTIERFAVPRSFADGEVLIEAGTPAPHFYVVRSGEVDAIEISGGKQDRPCGEQHIVVDRQPISIISGNEPAGRFRRRGCPTWLDETRGLGGRRGAMAVAFVHEYLRNS